MREYMVSERGQSCKNVQCDESIFKGSWKKVIIFWQTKTIMCLIFHCRGSRITLKCLGNIEAGS